MINRIEQNKMWLKKITKMRWRDEHFLAASSTGTPTAEDAIFYLGHGLDQLDQIYDSSHLKGFNVFVSFFGLPDSNAFFNLQLLCLYSAYYSNELFFKFLIYF